MGISDRLRSLEKKLAGARTAFRDVYFSLWDWGFWDEPADGQLPRHMREEPPAETLELAHTLGLKSARYDLELPGHIRERIALTEAGGRGDLDELRRELAEAEREAEITRKALGVPPGVMPTDQDYVALGRELGIRPKYLVFIPRQPHSPKECV